MSCEIQVFCEINPSEDPSKIKTAVLNIFPDLEISISNQQLIGKSSGFNSLSNIIASIHTKNTGRLYQRILKKNSDSQKTYVPTNHPQHHPFLGTLRCRGLDCFAWFQYHW